MGWSGGTFTRDTGVFTGSTAWKQTDDSGEGILSTRHDTHDQDLADGINATLKKDGGNTPSANLPMGGFRHTNAGKASSASDYARADQVQGNELAWGGSASGTDTLTLSLSPSLGSYTTGMVVWFQAANNNTGAVTMNIDSVGAAAVQKNGSALVADDIVSGRQYGLLHDGTNFQIFALGLGAGTIDTADLADEAVTYAKMQHISATSRILGRRTAGAGDVEECTLSQILDFVGSAAHGDILYRGSSSWARLGAGTDGQFLQTQGAAANPQWADAGGGTAFIATADLSNDATADFTGFDSSKYDAYLFVLQNVIPAADDVQLHLRTSTDGGSNYDSGASDYFWISRHQTGTTQTLLGDSTEAELLIAGGSTNKVGSAAGEDGVSGRVWIHGPHLAFRTQIHSDVSYFDSVAGFNIETNKGYRDSAADVDAVRFLLSSGNLESGTITMYGLKNA